MGANGGFFGGKKLFGQRKSGTEHFQIRPLAQHDYEDDPTLQVPISNQYKTPQYGVPPQAVAPYQPVMPQVPPQYEAASPVGVPVDPPSVPSRGVNGHCPVGQARQPHHQHLGFAPQQQPAPSAPAGDVWNDQYDRSLDNIQDHIHAVAGAVAMLDAVEHKMIAIKLELQRIHDAGLMIDGNKVLVALQTLADYVNQSIESVDDQCVNMLRDAKLDIRFAEMDTSSQPDGVALTMISLDRLLDFKIKSALTEGLVAEETPEFVDDICAIVSSNIQVLTSIMLALFASRDYTQAVTKLAARERIIPTIESGAGQPARHSTIDEMQLAGIDQQIGTKQDQLQRGRASLTALLKDLRENRTELGASFN
ncbi:MAG: hypothetical protein ACR2PI_10315 [Hyphomicrobiaceae bacterium]